jgi:glycosyltransferase involved in cell wall biosynthesis
MVETDVMKHSNRLIVQNQWTKEYMGTLGYDDARIAVIPNAVDLRDFPPHSDADDSYILFVGRLDWNKRPEMVLEAFARLDKELQSKYTVRIIGTGYSAGKLWERARALGISSRVQFLGFLPRSEVLRQISRCTVLVLPSLYESFPVVMLEGMACRKTVIASDIPGPQDAISSGKNGLLFKSSSLDQFVDMIKLALSDDAYRLQIGRSARALVESKYTFVSTAREYLSVASSIGADDI